MSSGKQVDTDNETASPSTEKNDEREDSNSKSSSSDDDDTDSNASSEYEVEKILGKRRCRRGGYEYYIKWVGYDESANEWIPESCLNCPQRLAEFEREEERKRKRTRPKREKTIARTRRANINKNRKKKRRVNIVKDDDTEDEEPRITKSRHSSSSSTTDSEKRSKERSITYGVEKGYQVQAILGINRTKEDQLHYLVHYKSPTTIEDNMELVPANIAKKYCEDELIQFYEARITWTDRRND